MKAQFGSRGTFYCVRPALINGILAAPVIPAKAGIQSLFGKAKRWIPAFAGMTIGAGWMLGAGMLAGVISSQSALRADEAYIVNQISEDVSIVDLERRAVVAIIPIGGKPAGVAISADGSRAFISSSERNYVSVVDTVSRHVLRRIDIPNAPLGIAAGTGDRFFVAPWHSTQVHAVDANTGQIIGTAQVGQSPSGVAVTRDGSLVLSADRDSDQVSIIDAATMQTLAAVKTGARPFGLTISDDGQRAYTANVGSNDVTIIDIPARRLVGTVKVGERPYAVALADGKAFVTNQYASSISVFDLETLATLGVISGGFYPEGAAASRDGRTVYVANCESNTMSLLDAQTLKITGEIAVGDGPRAFGHFIRPTP